MPVNTEKVSLKGSSQVWGGLVDFSELAPSAGMFTTLKGAVVGKDGTELERAPGSVLAGTPFLGEMIRPQAGTAGWIDHSSTDTTLKFNQDWIDPGYLIGHGLEFSSGATTATVWLNIVARTATGFPRTQGSYTATVTGSNELRITGLDSSSWNRLQEESEVYVSRDAGRLHGMIWAGDAVCVVAESVYYPSHSGTTGQGAKTSLSTWVSRVKLDWQDPTFFPTTVRIDQKPQWQLWPSPVMSNPLYMGSSKVGNSYQWGFGGGTGAFEKYPVHFNHPPRRKANLHAANDDLIIAVPGYGCVLTCTLRGREQKQLPITQWTRALGVPKGLFGRFFWQEAQTPGNGNPFTANQKFWLSVGFRNRFTGEVGLPSDPILMTAPGKARNYLLLDIENARSALVEAAGMSIILYSSGISGQETAGFEPIYEHVLDPDLITVRINFDRDWFTASGTPGGWVQFPSFPRIEQLPMGSSWAITIRGTTLFGGAIGYSGTLSVERIGILSWWIDRARFMVMEDHVTEALGGLSAGKRLSSAYQGIEARTRTGIQRGNTASDSKDNQVVVNLMERSTVATSNRNHEFSIEGGLFEKAMPNQFNYLDVQMPRGQVWFSEAGHPGITPAINRLLIDLVEGEDIRSAGRIGDSVMLCTENETYSVSWGRSPLGSHPRILSNTYGSIAPNGMVDFPGGIAWLSKDGPVLSDGGPPAWIGATIAKFWSTLERDSNGLMWQACSVYDQENKRIIWGVRQGIHQSQASQGAAADGNDPVDPVNADQEDDTFSTLPNDTLIILNVESGAFTVEELPNGNQVIDLERMPDSSGVWRIFALEEDGNVYQFDDRMTEHAQNTREWTADVASAASNGFTNSTITSTSMNVGEYAAVRSATTGECLWMGVMAADSISGSAILTDATAAVWAAGDILEVGMKRMLMETTYKAFLGWDRMATVVRGHLIHTTENKNPTSTPARAFARMTMIDSDENEVVFGSDHGEKMNNHHTIFETGYTEYRATKVKVEVITNAHVRIKDIQIEVAQGG